MRHRLARLLGAAVCALAWTANPTLAQGRLAPEASDPLAAAARLLSAGAPGLALSRLEQAPPGPEAVRLRAEAARRLPAGTAADRLRIVTAEAMLGDPSVSPAAVGAWLAGAEAGLRLGPSERGPSRARRLAAAAIWSSPATDAALEPARRLVVRSLFAEGLDDEGYAALLRWRLDAPQAEPGAIAEMAALLAASRHAREALPLVAMLPAEWPVRLLLQARLGVGAPAEVARRVRAELPARAAAEFWRLARDVGRAGGDAVLVAESGLRLLAAGEPLAQGGEAGAVDTLRADLRAAAAVAASERQLLTGDDFGWMDEAARLAGSDPPRARALFAGLAESGASAATREHARLQWVLSLREAGLAGAALRLLPPPGGEAVAPSLPVDLARQLGAAALAAGDPAGAVAYWRRLPPPPAGDPQEWALTLAQALIDSGEYAQAVRELRSPGRATAGLDPRLIALAERLTDAGASAESLALLEGATAPDPLARALWLARARAAEAQGLAGRPDRSAASSVKSRASVLPPDAAFAQAAAGYLAAAGAGPSDALAVEARWRAARNLERAGMREAARAEYEAVARQSRDPALRDLARRALSAN